jgi:hypothetical protein
MKKLKLNDNLYGPFELNKEATWEKIFFLPTSKLKITRLIRQQGFWQKMVNIRPKLK